jgi:predicted DCC family thiol-disulfide oxidoreductase YuxK
MSNNVPLFDNPYSVLVFDGQCGFCTRWVQRIKRLDRANRLVITPWQQMGVLERFGLSSNDVRRAAWFFGPNHGKVSGASAINAALDTVLCCDVFTLLYNFPLVKWLQDSAYAWIAKNRRRLPGVRALCKAQPEQCR